MRVGIDLGGTNIKIGLVDDKYNIIAKGRIKTNVGRSYSEIIADMAQLIKTLANENNISIGNITAIGIGSPGVADSKNGILIFSNNLNWHNVPVRQELQRHFDVPVFLENDANCAAIGESLAGASKQYSSSVLVTLGTGIGGGIIIDNKIHSGFNGAGGEIGHMVIEADGIECSCGRKGCFERYASATALANMAEQAAQQNPDSLLNEYKKDGKALDGMKIFNAARRNDPVTLEILDKFRYYASVGIANIVNILQPQAVVIGGGISEEGEYLIAGIRERVYEQMYSDKIEKPVIVKASLGNDAGIIGAAFQQTEIN